MELKNILYGGDYNPEQWLDAPDILEKDIEYMKEAGINTVTMGMFSWAALEPEEGEYNFEWLEKTINRLYKNGISTILATPSGARPKWLSDKYPEVLRVSESRVRNLFGGRHNHCYTSSVYRKKIREVNGALAARFSSNPAIILWHISNEYGGDCHCPLCQKAFQEWLKDKYGTIHNLNKRWCTMFWSHVYQSFEQVESPSSIGENELHGLKLDWKRFVTDRTTDFLKWEIQSLKASGAKQPVTVNLMYDYKGLNYDSLAECIDIVSWDSYPVWHKREDVITARDNGMQHDYMRSLKHKPFLLMESCPSAPNWQGVSKLKRPGLLTAASLQAIAHGSDSVLYFQIRQSRGSSEKFHGAVIDHYGSNDTRVFKEIKSIGRELAKLSEILGSSTDAKAAIIYDVENSWAMEDAQGPRNDGMFYHEAVMKSYNALKKTGVDVDIISEKQDISKYKLVIAPMLYLMREGIEDRLKQFTAKGGNLVMTYWSGIVDCTDRCHLGATPHGLTDVLGLRRTEIDGLYDNEINHFVPTSDSFMNGTYECRNLCDLVEVSTGKPFMEYSEEFYKGTPSAVKNEYGTGVAYYIAADVNQQFYDDLYSIIVKEAKLEPLVNGTIPESIEVTSRFKGEYKYVFVQNFNNKETDIRDMKLEGEVLYGEGLTTLKAYDSVILKIRL